ncbi:MAG: family 10 glycosylhydrolase [Prolixibacteraceae bacterium]
MNKLLRPGLLIILLLLCLGTNGMRNQSVSPGNTPAKKPEQKITEFRGVFVATINNIDWPSRPNLSVEEQKREFLKLLDSFQKFNLNVVILQVRAASDAFYLSRTEPWSVFLTGKQGKPPVPFYDPLAWAIEMCHKRGMELHAWFNPFRVRNAGHYVLDPNGFATRNPQFVREYDKKFFLDPGYPEVRSHVLAVIAEVARNYDVDAILLDDYFYPYPVQGKKFGDEKSFAKYGKAYFPKRQKEWRRENINLLISALHDTLLQINPTIKFGISPFGIWRNKASDPQGSPGIRGLSSYDDLYADVRKWLQNNWIDYVIPQLYWEKGNHFGDFISMVNWWSENSFGKPLYIGQALYKTTNQKNGWLQPDELNNQINFLRTNEKVRGFAFYSASNIRELSAIQVKALYDNQLNYSVAIDDDRRKPVPLQAELTLPVAGEVVNTESKELAKQHFILSLKDQPVSERDITDSLKTIQVKLRIVRGTRILSFQLPSRGLNHSTAIITLKKIGENEFTQAIQGTSENGSLMISAKQWKEIRGQFMIVVERDLQSKKEHYSNYFDVKRRRIKKAPQS